LRSSRSRTPVPGTALNRSESRSVSRKMPSSPSIVARVRRGCTRIPRRSPRARREQARSAHTDPTGTTPA
jgi:hypothetical protein